MRARRKQGDPARLDSPPLSEEGACTQRTDSLQASMLPPEHCKTHHMEPRCAAEQLLGIGTKSHWVCCAAEPGRGARQRGTQSIRQCLALWEHQGRMMQWLECCKTAKFQTTIKHTMCLVGLLPFYLIFFMGSLQGQSGPSLLFRLSDTWDTMKIYRIIHCDKKVGKMRRLLVFPCPQATTALGCLNDQP